MMRWTPEEKALLERYYPRFGSNIDMWPERPDRTQKAVEKHAHIMHVGYQGQCHLTEVQQEKLAKAWRLIAEHLGVDARDLVDDLRYLRRRGML